MFPSASATTELDRVTHGASTASAPRSGTPEPLFAHAASARSDSAASDASLLADPARTDRRRMRATIGRRAARMTVSSLMVAGDIGAYLAAYALLTPFLMNEPGRVASTQIFTLAGLVAIVFYAFASIYPGYRIYDYELLRRRATASFKVMVLAVAAALILTGDWHPALLVAGLLSAGLVIQPFAHQLVRQVCRRLGIWGERAAVIADPDTTVLLLAHFTRHWQYGIRPEPLPLDGREPMEGSERCIALIAGGYSPPAETLAAMRRDFREVLLLADTPNMKLSGLQPVDFHGEIGLRLAIGQKRSSLTLARRALDLAIALPAAVLAAPIIALAGAAIYAFDPGSIFYWQKREGLAGKPVRVLKLRTMYQDAEQRLEALFKDNPALKAEWLQHFKLKQDPRILPVIGRLLRSTSCDELPQLFNVIAGDMSIVGPRPFPEYHLMAMNAEFRHKRRSVVPGLTGLWQISARSDADLNLQRQIDEFYIDNRSMWFDLHIIISTIPALFRRGGAY